MDHENLTPQEEMYNHGIELAYAENAARDREQNTAGTLAALDVVAEVPGVEVPETVRHDLAAEALRHRTDALAYSDAVGALIGRDVFVESEDRPSGHEKIDALMLLTPEQKEKAEKIIEALVKKFELDPGDVGIVMIETDNGEKQPVVMHTGDYGICKGSWNSICAKENAKDYRVKIDGKQADTRSGMTLAAYSAFIADARARGVDPLPDSLPLSQQNGEPWTGTWLTGEQATSLDAPGGVVQGDFVYNRWHNRDRGSRDVRFRPAVVIE
jgi:hypothetical protein